MKKHLFVLIALFFTTLSCKEHVVKKELKDAEKTVELVTTFSNPTSENSSTPRFFNVDSKLYMSWVVKNEEKAQLEVAFFNGEIWNDPVVVSKGNDWFNNWADFPAIAVSDKNIFTNYLQKSAPDTYTYDVKFNVFNDSLKKWKKNNILHDDGTKSEHGFVSTVPDGKGGFFVSWLDGRNTAGGGHHGEEHSAEGSMTLRSAQINKIGEKITDVEIDNRVCDCCGTSMALSNQGPVVVYRDRDENEIRDISISRMIDSVWSEPKTVHEDNWKIGGCPVNGPVVASFENQLAVAWFTGVQEKPKVQVVFSENNGQTFGLPIRIDSKLTLGRVDLKMISEDEVVVSWMEQVGDETLVQLLKVDRNGSKGKVITLSKTSAERASGFPQIAVLNAEIYSAMTIVADGKPSRIKTVSVNIEAL